MKINMRMKINIAFAAILAMYISMFGVSAAGEYMSKDIIYSMEFENSTAGFERLADSNTTVKSVDGKLVISYVESQPWLPCNSFEINASDVTEIIMAAESEVDVIYKIFYSRASTSPEWSEERKMEVRMNGGEGMREYKFDVASDSNWTGTITRFRIDFLPVNNVKTNTVKTDYIRFAGKEVSSITKDDSGFRFELNNNSAADGLGINESVSDANLANGTLSGNIAGSDAEVHTNGIEAFAAKDYGSISLKYRNATSAEKAYVYFACDGSGGKYSDDYKFELDVVPNDTKIREYTIATGNNKNWLGNISGLKIMFGADSGSFEIDELGVYKYPYTISTSNDILSVSGKLSANDTANIQVVRAEYEDIIEDIEQGGNYFDAVIYTDDAKTGADGEFEFSYPLEPSEEPQSFVVMLADSGKSYTSRISYIDAGYPDRALAKINAAVEDKKGIYDEVTKAYTYLGLESAGYYDYLGKYNNISDFEAQMIKNGVSADLNELEKSIEKASVFALIKGCAAADLPDNAKKYESILNLEKYNSYSIYSELEASEKADVLSATRETANTLEELRESFEEKAVIFGIKFNMGADKVRKIIEDNAEAIGVDASSAAKLKNPDKVYIALAGHTYASYEEIRSAYADAVKKCRDDENSNSSSGPGSSGGGGGGSSIKKPTISVLPNVTEQQPTKEIFADLSGHWAKDSIITLYNKGIISGKSESEFAPDDYVTREEFIKMTVNAFDIKGGGNVNFSDTDSNAWYYDFICRAVNAGLVNGNTDGSFGIGRNITREDMAVIIFRYKNDMNRADGNMQFADSEEISEYAAEAVKSLSGAGIIKGTDGRFEPKAYATRAETAVIIERILSYIGG